MKKLFVLLVATILLGCSGLQVKEEPTIPLRIHNNTPLTVIARVSWINHPWGCHQTLFGEVKCDFEPFVAEIQPYESTEWIMEGDYIGPGNQYRITIKSVRSLEKYESIKEFTLPAELKEIEITITK